MVVLIYGSHRVSEPLAYEVGQKILQRAPTIKGIENPYFERSDPILLFNRFCEGIRKGELKQKITDFDWFLMEEQIPGYDWTNEIAKIYSGQAVYDLHDRFNIGALHESTSKLIPQDSPTLRYRPNDGTLAVIEIIAAETDAYPDDTVLIKNLAQRNRLKVIYEKLFQEKEAGLIEIHLPDDLSKYIGVKPENREALEQAIKNELSSKSLIEERRIKYGDKLQEALELDELRVTSPFLIPNKSDPKYSKISDVVTEFLIEFFKLHN